MDCRTNYTMLCDFYELTMANGYFLTPEVRNRITYFDVFFRSTPDNGGYGEDHVLGYENGALAVQALLNGQIDAVIIDNGPAQAYVAANPGLTLLEGDWVTEDYCLAVDEGNTALLEKLNGALEELIADGTVQTIIDKYITAD